MTALILWRGRARESSENAIVKPTVEPSENSVRQQVAELCLNPGGAELPPRLIIEI